MIEFDRLGELSVDIGLSEPTLTIICLGAVYLLGLLVGSFLNVCIYRIPLGESIIFGASHCTKCNAKIKRYDLIPVISYLLLRGKCRSCKGKITPRYAMVELINAILYLLLFIQFGISYQFLGYCVFFSTLIVIALIDYDTQTIPNGLVIIILLAGIALSVLPSDIHWSERIIGLFAVSVPLLLAAVISRGGMGGGDIKLMAVAGLCIGWKLILLSALIGSVVCAIAGIFMIVVKKQADRKTALPFGPFLALGIAISVLWGNSLIGTYLSFFGLS